MKKTSLTAGAVIAAFLLGFAIAPDNKNESKSEDLMKKVTGIGGVFFKCKDPERVKEWYSTHLGMETDEYGTSFEWRQGDDPSDRKSTRLNSSHVSPTRLPSSA